MMEKQIKLQIEKIREQKKLAHEIAKVPHEWSKLAILVGATFLLAILAWRIS